MPPAEKRPRVLVIHGPNLNMLGQREPEVYGRQTLREIDADLQQYGQNLGLKVESFQSNHEGDLVERIQAASVDMDGLIINPAAYTHTSVAIRDALLLLKIPVVEVHLSNIHKREKFRHKSMTAGAVSAQLTGFGAYGYNLALQWLARQLVS
jgi:3-dehydroquinate dehydratase-2